MKLPIFVQVDAVKLLVSKGADVNYCTLDYSGRLDYNAADGDNEDNVAYDNNNNANGMAVMM